MRWLTAGVLTVGLAVAGWSGVAQAEVVWLCKPGDRPDPCRESQETTIQEPDGSSRVETPATPEDPPVDCFYVYPTVSDQRSTNADKSKDPEVLAIARYQAARYSQQCKVYAPVYRQLTIASIFTGTAEQRAEGRKIAYADVREAWLEYLREHNGGRGVVLIGHSQGTGMLRQLMRQEVDPRPEVRRRLVSALLLGGNVLVRRGRREGGDFANVPACTSATQLGCVVAFSIFGEDPPSNARFGRAPQTDTTGAGLPAGPDYEVLCTNPASLDANERRPLTTYVRSEPFPGSIGAGLLIMYGGPPPSAPTPWLRPADRYSGRCEQRNGANVLMAEPIGGARRLNPSPTPDWGLHLADANMPLGELVDLVAAQARAHVRAGATSRRACVSRRTVALHVRRPKGLRIRRVDAFVGGRHVGRARGRRIVVRLTGLPRGTARVRLRITGTRRGRTVRVTQRRTFRTCVPRRG
jgi:hypothetical protein